MTPENVTITLPAELAAELLAAVAAFGTGSTWTAEGHGLTALVKADDQRAFWSSVDSATDRADDDDVDRLGLAQARLVAEVLTQLRRRT